RSTTADSSPRMLYCGRWWCSRQASGSCSRRAGSRPFPPNCRTASWTSCCGRSRSSSGGRLQPRLLVEVLQQVMGRDFDVLMPPLGCPAYEGISRLRLVRRALGQSQMPLGILLPRMRFEVGVLRFGPRLRLAPVAVENVLAGIDERSRLGHRGFVEQV